MRYQLANTLSPLQTIDGHIVNWRLLLGGRVFVRHPFVLLTHSARYDNIISHAPEGDWSRIAPLRILSFDIECAGRKGIFPEASTDPVIQIANMVTRQGLFLSPGRLTQHKPDTCNFPGEQKPFIRNVFTLNTCAHIVGSQVLSFQEEAKMLLAWRDFIEKVDPDVVIGYNTAGFDFPYLMDRAKALKVVQFPLLGRIRGTPLLNCIYFMLMSPRDC